MTKEKLLFGLGGIVLGFAIGFIFANSVNRSTSIRNDTAVASDTSTISNSGLPSNHPPLPGQKGGSTQGGAIPEVTAAIEKARSEPDNYEAQMTAGDLYYQIQRFDDALKFYENANRLRPAETEPSLKIGNTHFDAERYEEAEQRYAAVLRKNPNDVHVRTDYGLTFFLREPRDVDRAIKEFNTALALEPDNEIALQNLALALKEKNDSEDLEKTLDKLAAVNPNNPVVLKQRPK
jgi:tetratricopeptide (TPR) repeat protein